MAIFACAIKYILIAYKSIFLIYMSFIKNIAHYKIGHVVESKKKMNNLCMEKPLDLHFQSTKL